MSEPLPIQTGIDLARLALRVIELARPDLDADGQSAIDLGAAALAVHVCDWHYSPLNATNERKRQFAAQYPKWSVLVDIINGVKHPHRKRHFLHGGAVRELEWEDADFWGGSQLGATVVVVHDGEERSVRTLVVEFCDAYIVDQAPASKA